MSQDELTRDELYRKVMWRMAGFVFVKAFIFQATRRVAILAAREAARQAAQNRHGS